MKCPHCQAENREGTPQDKKFCYKCGHALTEPELGKMSHQPSAIVFATAYFAYRLDF